MYFQIYIIFKLVVLSGESLLFASKITVYYYTNTFKNKIAREKKVFTIKQDTYDKCIYMRV